MTVTIVVIEDDPATRDLIVGYLIRRGNRVTGCGSLAEAARALPDMRPDVVVSDVGLPDGNGADFCLDNVARLPHARWLIMSAQPEMLEHVRRLAKCPDGPPFSVFGKPVPLRAFDDVVRQAKAVLPPVWGSAPDGQLEHIP